MKILHGGNIFEVARNRGWDWREILDFSASINPLGPSPRVRPAIEAALDRIVHYPDRYASELAGRLAAEWNVEPDQILLGNGATDLIHFLARTWRPPNPALLVPTFSELYRAWPRARRVSWHDPRQWPDEGLIIATQPNNPTGELLRTEVLDRKQPMLIDESFIDFTDAVSVIGGPHLVLRSLTKFHALPGLRIGALVGPGDLMRKLRVNREPWQVNVLAEAAALEALADRHHSDASRAFVAGERSRMLAAFQNLARVVLAQSQANFFFARLEYSATQLCAWMLERKVLLRNCTGEPGIEGECVRFAIRCRADNDRLLTLWKEFECA